MNVRNEKNAASVKNSDDEDEHEETNLNDRQSN